jgi:hypothetical protein
MANFLTQRWRRQPQYPVNLRPEYAASLVCLCAPWVSLYAGDNNPGYWTASGTPTRGVSSAGITLANNSSSYLFTTASSGLINAYPYSVFALFSAPDVSTNQGLFSSGNVAANNARTQFDINAGAVRQIDVDAGGSAALATSAASLTANTLFSVAGVSASAASRSVYINGGGKVTDTTAITLSGTHTETRVGAIAKNAAIGNFTGEIPFLIALRSALSDAEIAEAYVAPYGVFFAPLPSRRYFGPPAGVADTLWAQSCL